MKLFQLIFRVVFSLAIAFAISLSSSVIYFNYSGYNYAIDRFMLVGVTTLAFGFLIYLIFPQAWAWITQQKPAHLIIFGSFALIASAITVFPAGTSRVYWLGMISFALALFTLMAPAMQSLKRISSSRSDVQYLISFLLSLLFTYGAMGYLSGTMYARHHVMTFAAVYTIAGSISGYYLVRRASRSLKNGFLSKPLNLFLTLTLPVFFVAMLLVSLNFPSMFPIGYIKVPGEWIDLYLCSSIVAGAWGVVLLEQIEKRGLYQAFRKTRLFGFIKDNLPGIYAGFMTFLVNVILARAINSLRFNIHSIIFEADAEPWLNIMGYPEGYDVNRAVHPLVLITMRPFTRFIGIFMGENWFLSPMISIAIVSGVTVLMAWIFLKRAVQNDTSAFIFSILFGVTASHLLFGSITETYVFGMASLIFFLLLIQADEKRFSVLVPAGLLVFGITITNIGQSMVELFFKKFGFWRLVRYGFLVLASGIVLTAFVSMIYPGNQTFFYVPQDILFEARFSQPIYASPMEQLTKRAQVVGRTIFLYGTLAPTPIEDYTGKQTDMPIIKFKTYNYKDDIVAWYEGVANIPLVLWILLMAMSVLFFIKNIRTQDTPLLLSLLGGLAFNYFLHMNYGDEIFLYSAYFTFLPVFFVAVALKDLAERNWFNIFLTVFLLMVMVNNARFIFIIMRGLAPYFALG
ncbi:MAG: hypothetical protein IH588_17485 [Anaerolineales bacterium]|nr:hypothetical protein [Anaerolineales bacterium]